MRYCVNITLKKWMGGDTPASTQWYVDADDAHSAVMACQAILMKQLQSKFNSAEFTLEKGTHRLSYIICDHTILVPTFELA